MSTPEEQGGHIPAADLLAHHDLQHRTFGVYQHRARLIETHGQTPTGDQDPAFIEGGLQTLARFRNFVVGQEVEQIPVSSVESWHTEEAETLDILKLRSQIILEQNEKPEGEIHPEAIRGTAEILLGVWKFLHLHADSERFPLSDEDFRELLD